MSETEAPPDALRCPRCGAAMNREQDWCLDCGYAATTRIMPPPSWGLPVAVVAIVAALVGLLLALTVDVLSDDAQKAVNRGTVTTQAATATGQATTATVTTTATTGTDAVPGAAEATGAGPVPQWPKDKSAYSIIVLGTEDKKAAEDEARQLITKGQEAGILRSDDYDFFSPGQWLVWTGVYADRAAAEQALSGASGVDDAYVTLVRPVNSGQ